MLRPSNAFSVLLVLGAVLLASSAGRAEDHSQASASTFPPLTLKSVRIDLPSGNAFPAGIYTNTMRNGPKECYSDMAIK